MTTVSNISHTTVTVSVKTKQKMNHSGEKKTPNTSKVNYFPNKNFVYQFYSNQMFAIW